MLHPYNVKSAGCQWQAERLPTADRHFAAESRSVIEHLGSPAILPRDVDRGQIAVKLIRQGPCRTGQSAADIQHSHPALKLCQLRQLASGLPAAQVKFLKRHQIIPREHVDVLPGAR